MNSEEFIQRVQIQKVCYDKFDDIMQIISDENKVMNMSGKARNLYARSRLVREDNEIGEYETLVIYQFEDDGTKYQIKEIVWCDEDGNILTLPEQGKLNRHAKILEHSEALEEKMKVRHIKLEAAKDISNEFKTINKIKKDNMEVKSLNEL